MEIPGNGIIMLQCIAHDPADKARYLLQASKKSQVQIERLRASVYVDRDCRGARRGGFCDRGLFSTIHQMIGVEVDVHHGLFDFG
jgi:hypothetical protein